MSDEEFAHEGFLVGADPEEHIGRLREMLGLGATVVCLQLIGDADVDGSIRRYGDEVLPALREARVALEAAAQDDERETELRIGHGRAVHAASHGARRSAARGSARRA